MTTRYTNAEWSTIVRRTTATALPALSYIPKAVPPPDTTEFAARIEHTLLNLSTTRAQIDALCSEARIAGFGTVTVRPCHAAQAVTDTRGSEVKVCAVIGLPDGSMDLAQKIAEVQHCLRAHVHEMDVMLDAALLKKQRWEEVYNDFAAMRGMVMRPIVLKAITETAALDQKSIVAVCVLAGAAGWDGVGTSTAYFSTGEGSASPARVAEPSPRKSSEGVETANREAGRHSRQRAGSLLERGSAVNATKVGRRDARGAEERDKRIADVRLMSTVCEVLGEPAAGGWHGENGLGIVGEYGAVVDKRGLPVPVPLPTPPESQSEFEKPWEPAFIDPQSSLGQQASLSELDSTLRAQDKVKRHDMLKPPKMRVKVSGTIRTLDDAMILAQAGAARLGTSSGVWILKEGRETVEWGIQRRESKRRAHRARSQSLATTPSESGHGHSKSSSNHSTRMPDLQVAAGSQQSWEGVIDDLYSAARLTPPLHGKGAPRTYTHVSNNTGLQVTSADRNNWPLRSDSLSHSTTSVPADISGTTRSKAHLRDRHYGSDGRIHASSTNNTALAHTSSVRRKGSSASHSHPNSTSHSRSSSSLRVSGSITGFTLPSAMDLKPGILDVEIAAGRLGGIIITEQEPTGEVAELEGRRTERGAEEGSRTRRVSGSGSGSRSVSIPQSRPDSGSTLRPDLGSGLRPGPALGSRPNSGHNSRPNSGSGMGNEELPGACDMDGMLYGNGVYLDRRGSVDRPGLVTRLFSDF